MPYADREKRLAYAREYNDLHRDRINGQQRDAMVNLRTRHAATSQGGIGRVFVGVDGEGHGEGSAHEYYLLRAGDRYLRTGKPLEAEECLHFLASLPRGPIYIVYYGTYDFTMILRKLPEEFLRKLVNRTSRAFMKAGKIQYEWARWGPFKMDYIPRKRFSIGYDGGQQIVIHDVAGFYQTSFVHALEQWNTATVEELAAIEAGKMQRGEFDATSDDVLEYNRQECILLAEQVGRLNDACKAVGLDASPFEGAGNLASRMLQKYLKDKPPKPPAEIPVMAAYYGGRFEITAHGPVRRRVYEYDICSAYPAAMLRLPCLHHGRWLHGDDPISQHKLGHVEWGPRDGSRPRIGPLPFRMKDGSIVYPLRGRGWYWSVEWPTGPFDYTVDDCWSWQQECECRPFDWIRGLYKRRQELGKQGKGYVLKLGLNSLYGKTAQRVGEAPWSNHVYAGLITAMTRKALWDAAMQAPEDVIMFATDAVYSLTPLNLDIGGELGQWEQTEYEDMHIVLPGIYFTSDGAKTKTRGIAQKTLIEYRDEIVAAFDRQDADEWGVEVEYNGFITLKLALSQNRLEKAGYFGKLARWVRYDYTPKRALDSMTLVDGVFRTAPQREMAQAESTPYGRTITLTDHEDEHAAEVAPEQPVQTRLF